MNQIDIRLSDEGIGLLKTLIGKKLESVEHDAFIFTNTSSQVVKLNSEETSLFLYSFTESLDYFGTKEDVSIWSIEHTEYPIVEKKSFIRTPVQQKIQSISLIQENQQFFEKEKQTYDVWLTRGIILDFGDHEFAFEKPVWFSEDIIIRKGYNLKNTFRPEKEIEMAGNWANGSTLKCLRSTFDIK